MAEARKHVERKYVEETTITLTLDAVEAETVLAVLAKVGGDPELSTRQHSNAVLEALEGAGLRYYGRPIVNSLSGHLIFE